MPLALDLSFPKDPVLPRMLKRLSAAQCRAVFILSAFLGRRRKLDGPSYHGHVADLLHHNITADDQLKAWLRGRFSDLPVHGPSFIKACRQADRWLDDGLWVASLKLERPCSVHTGARCPRVIFGKGSIDSDQRWSAFFNSRKGKAVSPHSEWIRVLRVLLPYMVAKNLGIATSFGTVTHDLVAAVAQQIGAEVLLMKPSALPESSPRKDPPVDGAVPVPRLQLSCMTEAVNCSKPVSMLCRDRLLAHMSDLHCVLELRRGGNLLKILEEQQAVQPRHRWIYRPEAVIHGNAGNLELLQVDCPRHLGFSLQDIGVSAAPDFPPAPHEASHHTCTFMAPLEVDWRDYLYHYVRPCPGPWPNQDYREYLISLFDGKHLAGHTVLETLVRILFELRIRASSRVVRGDTAVVSWSSRPPFELGAIRRWNPALIRWTLEPYGVAVKRGLLKELGAKPVVYGASSVYEKLPQDQQFRFQLHEPPRCSWKNEREWRLPKDLNLKEVDLKSVFGFVPSTSDADAIHREIYCALPIVVLANGNG